MLRIETWQQRGDHKHEWRQDMWKYMYLFKVQWGGHLIVVLDDDGGGIGHELSTAWKVDSRWHWSAFQWESPILTGINLKDLWYTNMLKGGHRNGRHKGINRHFLTVIVERLRKRNMLMKHDISRDQIPPKTKAEASIPLLNTRISKKDIFQWFEI